MCLSLSETEQSPLMSPALQLLDKISAQSSVVSQLEKEFDVVKRLTNSLHICQEKWEVAKKYGVSDELVITNYVQLNWKMKILAKLASNHTGTVLGAPKEQLSIVDEESLKIWLEIIDNTRSELHGKAKPDEDKIQTIDLFS